MGVLMSRRQTVEQVQKVSLAVSAFKDGLRERPAAKRSAEGAASRRGTLEEHAVQELRDEEEPAPAPGEASRPGGSRTASAAWARLRDGRGVEPEDLDRPGCFLPPALVRPVRPPPEEKERLEISLEQREQDNLNSLLTQEEMDSLSHAFQQSNIAPESSLSLEDFLRYKGLGGQPSSEEEKERQALQFGALDPGQKGHIAWMDFLSHESLLLLQRTRTQEGLLHLLTGKERERAREAFLALNQQGDGLISQDQSRHFQNAWFRKRHPGAASSSARASQAEPVSEGNSQKQEDKELPRDEPGEPSRTVTWPAFLRESTIYILAARPNSAAIHLKPSM
ncbi:PHD finger protein 24 isoform X3 [Ahaetulla prasina]|uniref:PHD finger protein 24 isoform X3 n=1 Tax=Ahaetulla prasina TaxID=499056 RepID=UPI0026488393|nr:PHD finger protein 24 isoform X3 [Ahaetulla prasina]